MKQVRPWQVARLVGLKFGKLSVVAEDGRMGKRAAWRCQCDCGNARRASSDDLRSGKVKSCGCLSLEPSKNRTHAMTNSAEYRAWIGMKKRCLNRNSSDWHLYGGRGIRVCEKWLNSFESFYADLGAKPSSAYSLDRINCDGDYEPGNCRWASPRTQANNRRSNRRVKYRGIDLTLAEAIRAHSVVTSALVHARLSLGWNLDRAMETPAHRKLKP